MADFLILDDDKNLWDDNNVQNKTSSIPTGSFIDKLNDFVISLQIVKSKEKVIFYRILSTMTNVWMNLIKSDLVLEQQEKNPIFKNILWRFGEELREWKNLSECLELYPSSFSEAEIWMVKSWEKTWQLNQVLNDLALQIEKVESLTWKIKSAMMYPMFIVLVVIWVVSVMMTMIVPKLLDIFDDKSVLPASTKVLIWFSDAFRNYWILALLLFIILFIVVSIWKKTPDWTIYFILYY